MALRYQTRVHGPPTEQILVEDIENLKRIVDTILSKNNPLPSPQNVQRYHSFLDETTGDSKYSEEVIFEALHLYKPDKFPKTTVRVTEGVSSIQHDQDKTKSQPPVTDKQEDTPEFQASCISVFFRITLRFWQMKVR